MSTKLTVPDLASYAQHTLRLGNDRLRELRRPLFLSNLDRDDRELLDMHVRAVSFVQPFVEELLERINSGEMPEDIAKERSPVDALDIILSDLDEFLAGY